jgi:hypothetical protein
MAARSIYRIINYLNIPRGGKEEAKVADEAKIGEFKPPF